ncbi:MAG: hypothetical protein HY518_01530 [Candidatus Aenigmarchaeota archaeon]|nr:hypothetical protein [Candidatus Aenigmarchaeota archaeon]
MARGIEQGLMIAVAAIVILIIALVVLTIFGIGLKPIENISSFRNNCMIAARSSCLAGALPINWQNNVQTDNGPTSCASECGNSCSSLIC